MTNVPENSASLPPKNAVNEAWRVSAVRTAALYLTLLLVGALFAAAFPAGNQSWLGWFGLIPLYLSVRNARPGRAFAAGFVWGFGFSVTAFFWLREIEPFIPFALGPILALFPAFWAWPIPLIRRSLYLSTEDRIKGHDVVADILSKPRQAPDFLVALSLACWWCVLEWVRSWIGTGLPWNYLAVTQWRNIAMIQMCAWTGVYGVSFLLVFTNIALAQGAAVLYRGLGESKFRRPLVLYAALVMIMIAMALGVNSARSARRALAAGDAVELRALLVQGDIPQSRFVVSQPVLAGHLSAYVGLTRDAMERVRPTWPDIAIWPETAVAPAFRGDSPVGALYRREIQALTKEFDTPFLLGSIDFGSEDDTDRNAYRTYNSALLIDRNGQVADTYNKTHLVPWGEYTPWGDYYPGLKRKFGMGRDLTPGSRQTLFELKPGVSAAVLICYEDVFPAIARRAARAGANLLIAITNDAWYPRSDEPVQHLAQSVFRAVENRLPLLRSGNNNGTCLINPDGSFAWALFDRVDRKLQQNIPTPERKGRGAGICDVKLARTPPLSFYARYGDVFILGCGLWCLFFALWGAWRWRAFKDAARAPFKTESERSVETENVEGGQRAG